MPVSFPALATELLARTPNAIVVSTNLAALAVQKLSRTVAIVGTGLNAPVATGSRRQSPKNRPAEISRASPQWRI